MKSVVVVEDDLAVGETIRAILEESYRVDVVTATGTVPLGAAAALVITDLFGRSGYDSAAAIRQVREIRVRTSAPVLVLTAHREATRDDGLAGEANAVMTKPFEIDELVAMVDRLAV